MSGNHIFALDIGTRSVVGVVLAEGPKGLEILASEQLEHQTRAMFDGQIHDIEQVAKAMTIVRERLQDTLGYQLNQVAVAAAGRSLKTVRLKESCDCAEGREIEKDDILRFELQTVQMAQKQLEELDQSDKEDLLNYHCVGYSVVQYELDGYRIGNLYSQKGRTMGVEVIATFLPRVVVDSMLAALNRAGLEMASLTLEPIAASTVVVPPTMRQLNIALVDIGAGTSDIAVTAEGSVVGYGMVPLAGDEVTEKISGHYLVDFNEAEKIKRTVLNFDEIRFTDVLGIENTASQQEVLGVISDAVMHLTKQIGEKIIELNGRTPQAVICIGGGSLTPLIKDMLADNLGLSKQRVAVRGREAIAEVFGAHEMVGPEAVTPIGIGVASYERKGLGFAKIVVNNEKVRIFEVNRSTVADALVAAGINIRKTHPHLGLALTVTVNGELKIIKGSRGKAATILLNGKSAGLDTNVQHNDSIEFIEAVDGENARGFIYDVVPHIFPISVIVNSKTQMINPVFKMNGKPVSFNEEIVDNAQIEYYLPNTVGEIMKLLGYNLTNDKQEAEEYTIFVNERIAKLTTVVEDGDDIVIEENGNLMEGHEANLELIVESNQTFIEEPGEDLFLETTVAEESVLPKENTTVYVNDEIVTIPRKDIIFADILTRISFSLKPPESGMRLEMKVNGVGAEFTTPLKHGDTVTLGWSN